MVSKNILQLSECDGAIFDYEAQIVKNGAKNTKQEDKSVRGVIKM